MNQIEHIKMMNKFYNQFRDCAELDFDDSLVKNVVIDCEILCRIEITKDEEWSVEPYKLKSPIKLTAVFEFNEFNTDDEIKLNLKIFEKQVLAHKDRHSICLNFATDSKGKKRDWKEITNNLENSFIAFKTGRPIPSIVSELNLTGSKATNKEFKYADKKATRFLIHGEKLIEAAKDGPFTFCRAAMEPLPRNL